MNSFAPSVAAMTAIPTKLMRLIFLLMVQGSIIFIVIVQIAIADLNNAMNLSMKSLKNGVDTNAFVAFVSN